jgi:hypothetical protein
MSMLNEFTRKLSARHRRITSIGKQYLYMGRIEQGWYYLTKLVIVLEGGYDDPVAKLWTSLYQPVDGGDHSRIVHHITGLKYLVMALLSIPLVVCQFPYVLLRRRSEFTPDSIKHIHIIQIVISCWDIFAYCVRFPGILEHIRKEGSAEGLPGPIPWCLLDEETQKRFAGRINSEENLVSIRAAEYFFFPCDVLFTKKTTVYDQLRISTTRAMVKNREFGLYREVDNWLYGALKDFPISGKRIAIIGSAEQGYGPWYETIALEFGAQPVVIEYNIPHYDNPEYCVMHVSSGILPGQFDGVISISSFEHTGLGRYGDPIAPDGDLDAMANWLTVLPPQGVLFLEIPIGKDAVVFFRHRIYGRQRLPRLLHGWHVLAVYGLSKTMVNRSLAPVSEEGAVFVLRPGDSDSSLDFEELVNRFTHDSPTNL